MTHRAETVLREALDLPVQDRAGVVPELIAGLDPAGVDSETEIHGSWVREVERRARRVLEGDSPGRAWSEVRHALGRRLADG